MEHLILEVFDRADKKSASKYITLPDDCSITVTGSSEIFATGSVWTHTFKINVRANTQIFGTSAEIRGARLHESLDMRPATLWVENVALYTGYLKLDDEVDIDEDGNIDVTFESGRSTFSEMISGVKANQVPLIGDVLIGMALWRRRCATFVAKLEATYLDDYNRGGMGAYEGHKGVVRPKGAVSDWTWFFVDGESDNTSVQEYPRLVYPTGQFQSDIPGIPDWSGNCINTDSPYMEDEDGTPTNPYCNIALCYQRQGYERVGADADYSADPEPQRGYEYMPANRVNSAPNFYVIYWIRALMTHLGIHIDENQMMDVEDLRRLFFVNTNCAYEVPDKLRSISPSSRYGRYSSKDHCIIPEYIYMPHRINVSESSIVAKDVVITKQDYEHIVDTDKITIQISELATDYRKDMADQDYVTTNNTFHKAYATSECFPNVDISEVISAIENGFGVRFLFDENYTRVRIILLRNIFRSKKVQEIPCEVLTGTKVENNIRGFRMTYGDINDTAFIYKGFDDKLMHRPTLWPDESDKHDYSQWNLDASYQALINAISAFDKTCYVTKNNGNAYGIKVDKNAVRYNDLHPALFEYAAFMDAEDGDCSGEESTVKTVNVGFTPAIMNDVNIDAERANRTTEQRYALFVDETMSARRPNLENGKDMNDPSVPYDVREIYERNPRTNMMSDGIVKPGEFSIFSDAVVRENGMEATLEKWAVGEAITVEMNLECKFLEGYRLYLQDNYKPNDDGVSPIEKHGWGLTLGIMRGTGSGAHVAYEIDPDDQEHNLTWHIIPGSDATSHPDTCDNYGREWGYAKKRSDKISLKLRAEKPNPYYNDKTPDSNGRYLKITNSDLQGRGLADTMYSEYSYFIRHARVYECEVRMTIAQLINIDKTVRVKVGDIVGFIRKYQFTVHNQTGMGNVKLEIMYI